MVRARYTLAAALWLSYVQRTATTAGAAEEEGQCSKVTDNTIPVVDFQKWFGGTEAEKAATAAALGKAFEEYGFVIAVNTSIDASTLVSAPGTARFLCSFTDSQYR